MTAPAHDLALVLPLPTTRGPERLRTGRYTARPTVDPVTDDPGLFDTARVIPIPLMPATEGDLRWTIDAECRDAGIDTPDQDVFFTEPGDPAHPRALQQARLLCGECPVAGRCLGWAIATGQTSGVWGGLTPPERDRLAARTGLTRLPRHGTDAGYRHDDCRCDRCRRAHAEMKTQSKRRADERRRAASNQVGDRPGDDSPLRLVPAPRTTPDVPDLWETGPTDDDLARLEEAA